MKARDLKEAVALRPRDVHELYGICPSTLYGLCTHPDPRCRLPSIKIPGCQGRKGIRLIYQAELVIFRENFGGELLQG